LAANPTPSTDLPLLYVNPTFKLTPKTAIITSVRKFMKLPRLSSRSAESQRPAESLDTTAIPEGYDGPVKIGRLGIRFLTLKEVHEQHPHLLPHVEPAGDLDEPDQQY
jgi:hypothetical protein